MDKMTKNILIALICLLAATGTLNPAHAKNIRPEYNVGGYLKYNKTPAYEFSASAAPRPLTVADQSLPPSQQAAFDQYLKDYPATTALLAIEDGQLLFEAYQGVGRPSSEFFSMSMAKSLSSMTVGMALCRGDIKSLNLPAKEIVPEFGDGPYGRSTIRQLLMMSSGAYEPQNAGQPGFPNGIGFNPRNGKPFGGASWPLRLGQVSIGDLLWGKWWDQITHKNANTPGAEFAYKSGDSLSLSKIVERATGRPLADYFDDNIWRHIGSEGIAHWETDKDGSTINSSGFQARARDWARIGIWTIDQYGKEDCFGRYLKEATANQIPVKSGNSFRHYGYQWWVNNKIAPGFWALGYAGQMMGIDPTTRRIILKFSYRMDPGSGIQIFKLLKAWP